MKVVIGIIRNLLGEILIAQRPQDKSQGGLWEFPGGKVEADERHFAALQRELKEELAIAVIAAEPWLQIEHDYPDRQVLLDIWKVTQFLGEPQGIEGQPLLWVKPKQLTQFEFPAGNDLILQQLMQEPVV